MPLRYFSANKCTISMTCHFSLSFIPMCNFATVLMYFLTVFGEPKKLDSKYIISFGEVEHFWKILTTKKQEILKSFHCSKVILPFNREEIAKKATTPADKPIEAIYNPIEVVVDKQPDLL